MVNFITNKPAIPANSTHVPLGCIDTFVEYQMFCSRYFQCCVRHQVCAFNSRARKFNRILLLWKCNCTLQKLTYVTKRLNLTKKEVITTNDLILLCNIYGENIYFWEVRDLCTILLSWGDFYAMMKFTVWISHSLMDTSKISSTKAKPINIDKKTKFQFRKVLLRFVQKNVATLYSGHFLSKHNLQ